MVRRLNLYRFLIRVVCYLLPSFAFGSSWAIRFLKSGPIDYRAEKYFGLCIGLTLIWIIASEYFGVTSVEELFIERTGTWAILKALTATYMFAITLLFLYRDQSFSRAFFLNTALVLFVCALFLRAAFRGIVTHQSRIGKPIRVLIVGTDSFARQAAETLVKSSIAACEIFGYLRINSQVVADGLHPVYELDKISDLRTGNLIDEVVFALPPADLPKMPSILKRVEILCVPVRVVLDVGQGIVIRQCLFSFGGLQLMDLSLLPSDSLSYMVFKRAFDIVFATLVLALTSPLLVLIAIGIKLSSPGPIIFKQDRVGHAWRKRHHLDDRARRTPDGFWSNLTENQP